MPSNNLISLSSVSNLRLENFRTQHELAKNFYDDYEFCPIHHVEEVTEHRERVQKRTSPYPSPNLSVSSTSSASSFFCMSSNYNQQSFRKSNIASIATPIATTNTTATRAIPIIDPSNMTPVAVPVHQQHAQKTFSNTSPSMPQWIAFKNNTSSMSTSPSSIHSNLSLSSSSSSSNSSISNNTVGYRQDYYYGSYQQPQIIPSTIVRAIPIIDPTTRQVFHHPQQQIIQPPGFYNVSVC
ncbi:hypothetical protein BD408DRAFT_441163 [Parasitella parasitica]|nr:hypothetical protein BD408DRAFT_441163 [Parasitella parasitica]